MNCVVASVAISPAKGCRGCESVKPKSSFYSQTSRCKPCIRNRDLLKRYGISQEDYNVMLQVQDGKCAICQEPPSGTDKYGNPNNLHVHHSHITGKPVALLCFPCNSGSGLFKDDPDLLRRAAELAEFALMTGDHDDLGT